MTKKPIPQPKQRPWERNRCQICVAKEAERRPRVCSRMPMRRVVRVEVREVV
jgi:hypothetical protein